MTAKLTLDRAGRVVIPKRLRDQLHLGPGDQLELDATGEHITLRPLRGSLPLQKERGLWVYRTGHPLPLSVVDNTIRQVREERDLKNLGKVR